MADETVPHVTADGSAPLSVSSTAKDIASGKPVVFAAPREVVQPLPGPQAESVAALSGEDIISVPERDFASLAAAVAHADVDSPLDEQAHCLATAIFYEARSESLEGQLGVARVIINRAHSPRFSDSLCGVVRQPHQFSFVRGGVIPAPKVKRPAWKTAIAIARIAIADGWKSKVEGALYFHARNVSPGWNRKKRLAAIDRHIFYR